MPKQILIPDTKWRLEAAQIDHALEPLGQLLVWEPPREGFRYVVACDPADGVGADRSAIMVNRVGTEEHPDELVAEWCGNVNPFDLPPVLDALGRWYKDSDGTEALLAVERNRGTVVQDLLIKNYNYTNLFVPAWHDKFGSPFSNRFGWTTNVETRPKLCSRGIQWIRERKWRINSPWLVAELATFEYDPEKARMEAAHGSFDDRVMAAFIALFVSHDWNFGDDVTATIKEEDDTKPKPSFQSIAISAEEVDNWSGDSQSVYY